MARPLVVYLDSQDFSKLSPSHRQHPDFKEIKRNLISLRDQGKARYVFSDVHLFECMPVERSQSHYGLERVRTIAELCGRNSLSSVTTVIEEELAALMGTPQARTWEEWFPHFHVEAPNREEINQEVINDLGSNRKLRRAMAKVLRKKGGSRADGEEFARRFVQEYPFMEGGKTVLRRYIEGRRSWEDVLKALYDGMRDIVPFSEWMVENWEHGQKFVMGLRQGNERAQRTLIDFHMKMKASYLTSGLQPDMVTNILKSVYEGERKKYISSFARDLSQNPESLSERALSELTVNKFEAEAPSLNCALSLLFEIFYHTSLPKNPLNPNKRSGSDLADALHIFHAPRADILRADKFACSIMARLDGVGSTVFCESLVELPVLIEERYVEVGGLR